MEKARCGDTVERRLGEDMLKLEPDLPAGEGPAEGSFGEPTDVFQEAWLAAPCHTNSQAVWAGRELLCPACSTPAWTQQRPGAGETERRESLQTMSYPLHCTIEGQEEHLRRL